MTSEVASRIRSLTFPELRAHQAAALAVFEDNRGADRFHFVLPPGAGKTLLGSVIAQHVGRRLVVLVPNTAIAAQWMDLWRSGNAEVALSAPIVGSDRRLDCDVTVLTYQAVATFDDEVEDDASPMARLHPNAREMIDRLHGGEPYTLVLDEAHHLAATWGELLAEVLRQAHSGRSDGPVVVALTATPRDSLSAEQAALVDELFGPVLYSVSTPALVRDGVLAPYREFAWFVDPTAGEREYLTRGAQRWRELVTAVMAPDFDDVGLLTYLDSAWVRHEGVSWSHIQRTRPELARALVRASFNGLIAVPQGARVLDEHRQPLQVEDWVAILSEYGRTVLAAPDPPAPGWEQLRAGLRSVGWTLTRNGARRGQSSVDRVLSRSGSKALAAGYLIEQEYLVRGDDLRAVVLTDFEDASATPPADTRSVMAQQAGSAWEALAAVQAANPGLTVVLVTGASVGGTRESLCAVLGPGQRLVDREDGLAQIEAAWGPRDWVPHITDLFLAGEVDVMVGTRGLLGEGWDAPAANVLIDLTAATTPTAVVQIRGRAIRRDPQRPGKVAHIWSVTTVDDEHPRGDLDYRRLVAKHRGYLSPDATGRILAGVEHLDSRCNEYAPPSAQIRASINAASLAEAGRIDQTRALWQLGSPYQDVARAAVRIRVQRAPEQIGVPEPAVRSWAGRPWLAGVVGAAVAGGLAVAGQVPDLVAVAGVIGAGAGFAIERGARGLRARRVRRQLGADGMLLAFGRAVAEAMAPGLSEAVLVEPDPDGSWVLRLEGQPAEASRVFAESVEQILLPVDFPRYIVSRRLGTGRAIMWHAVPDAFGVNKTSAAAYAQRWRTFVSRGDLLYTGSAEGAATAETVRGLDPMDLTTAMYAEWG
ncbi:MAG: DEAD/DEAH box helicase family protein [Candidatus Nanopelagicales bacterium]